MSPGVDLISEVKARYSVRASQPSQNEFSHCDRRGTSLRQADMLVGLEHRRSWGRYLSETVLGPHFASGGCKHYFSTRVRGFSCRIKKRRRGTAASGCWQLVRADGSFRTSPIACPPFALLQKLMKLPVEAIGNPMRSRSIDLPQGTLDLLILRTELPRRSRVATRLTLPGCVA